MKSKVFKRAIAVVIAAMVLASMFTIGISASAATMKYNIDTTKTGSLTLYKYEMDDVSTAPDTAIGKQTDSTKVPAGATVLPGVTFKIWKIADLTQYFKPDGASLPTVSQAEGIISQNSNTPSYQQVTNAQGMATFSNLPLGIYYVKEIDGPPQVTSPVAPFVLSIPMTDKTNADEWFYDVYAFPKNQTAYSDIRIKKVDASNNNVLGGAKFTLYESDNGINGWTVKQTNITTAANGIAGINSVASQKYYRFVETQAPSDAYILDSTVTYDFYVDATGDMFTYTVNGNTVNLSSTAISENTLVVSNEMPKIHKYILDKAVVAGVGGQVYLNPNAYPNGAHEGIDNTANIGDTVHWVIKVDVPTNIGKLSTFTVEDTMGTGLQYVTCAAATSESSNLFPGEDFTVTQSGQKVTMTFDTEILDEEDMGGKTMVILFDTLLTSAAPLATDIPNDSKLIYTNKVGTDSTHELESEEPTVHTGGLQFRKTDGTNPLQGVEFKIYATENDAKNNTNCIQTATTNAQGIVTFTGLKYGSFSTDANGKAANGVNGGSTDYWVAETKTVAGYSLLSAPFRMTVDKDSHLYTNNDDVINNLIPNLPKTGGIGVTALFVISGGMVAFGVVMLLRRKKTRKD